MVDASTPVELGDIWTYFAERECGEYSPLYNRICRTVASNDDVLNLVREAPPRSHQPNVLLGAVHFLVLGGLDHPLAAVYAGTQAPPMRTSAHCSSISASRIATKSCISSRPVTPTRTKSAGRP